MVKLSKSKSGGTKVKVQIGGSSRSRYGGYGDYGYGTPAVGYTCNADRGCIRGSRYQPGEHRTAGECHDACRKEFYRCDRERGCELVYSDLPPEERAAAGIYASAEECKRACAQYYACRCGGECETVFSDEPVPVGADSPRPGTLFQHTADGKSACEAAQNCNRMCAGSVVGIVLAVLVAALVIGLVSYLVYAMRHSIGATVRSGWQRLQTRPVTTK